MSTHVASTALRNAGRPIRPVAVCALLTALGASAFLTQVDIPVAESVVTYDAAATQSDASSFIGGVSVRNADYSNAEYGAAAEPSAEAYHDAAARLEAASRTAEREPLAEAEAADVPTITTTIGNNFDADLPEGVVAPVTVPGQASNVRMEVRTTVDPFERVERRDANRFSDLPPLVVQAGRDGEMTRIYRYDDAAADATGVPVLKIVASERQDEIIAIGTRARLAPAAFYGDSVTGGIPESVWVALAQCESGGRANVISAGGRFHGLYQFSVATWRSVGGYGLPSDASPQEQRYRAVRLQARSGWGQWPSCSRRIGVR